MPLPPHGGSPSSLRGLPYPGGWTSLGGLARHAQPGISISPPVAADGTQGSSYAGQTFTATGGTAPYTWAASNLPPGLSINSGTGAVTGTPTTSGTYTATLTATDAHGAVGAAQPFFMVLPGFSFSNTLGTANDTITVQYNGSTYVIPRPVPSTGTSAWAPSYTGTIFVATTGNDSTGNGSAGSPYATLNKAVSVAVPGSVIQMAAGRYVEPAMAHITNALSGSSGSPTVITCAPGAYGQVVLALTQPYVESFFASNAFGLIGPPNIYLDLCDWVIINGLCLEGYLDRGWNIIPSTYSSCGVTWNCGNRSFGGHNDHCSVTNCVIYNQWSAGNKHISESSLSALTRGNVSINIGNQTTDHGDYITSDGATIDANVYVGMTGYGIHSYNGSEDLNSPASQTITNNLVFANKAPAGGGLLLASHGGTVNHNTFANNPGVGIFYFRGGCQSNTAGSNVATGNSNRDLGTDASSLPSGNTDAGSDYLNVDPNAGTNGVSVTGNIASDPLYLNAAGGDYRPAANGPATAVGCYPNPWTSGISMTPSSTALSGTNGQAFSQTFTPSGTGWTAPVTFAAKGTLPAGLSLNTSTGVLSGTPTVSGTFGFGITATDSSATPKRVGNRYTLTLSPQIYVKDTFTGTNGTLLTAHTPDVNAPAGSWTAYAGTSMQIQSNQAQRSAVENELTAIEGGHSDGILTVDVAGFTGAGDAIVARLSDANNYWKLYYNSGTLNLQKVVAGVGQALTAQANATVPGTAGLICNGSSWSITWNGATLATGTDSFNSTATKFGLLSNNNAGTPTWDNFQVTALS